MKRCVLFNVLLVAICSLQLTAAEFPNLTGTILDEDEKPVAGATVQIHTAKVKEGTSPICPSCYLDCGKRATTDAAGRFTIESLDDELLFNVLVAADGYLPQFMDAVDPAAGDTTALLIRLPEARLKPEHRLEGRVVGPGGEPVAGAVIEPYGMRLPGGGTRYGAIRGADALAVTNEQGAFAITTEEPGLTLLVKVSARGLAPRRFNDLVSGGLENKIELAAGSLVSGRVMQGGKPVPQAVVGIVGADRAAGSFIEETTAGVDEEGRFSLANVPAGEAYFLYVKRDSIAEIGATEIKAIAAGADGTITDAGTIELGPGHRLAGRVRLSDGAELPPSLRVMISRDDSWDPNYEAVDEEGRFSFSHVAPGEYGLHLRVPGYRMSEKNRSLDPTSRRSLVGTIDADIQGIEILLEPAGEEENTWHDSTPEDWKKVREMRTQPLRGAEGE